MSTTTTTTTSESMKSNNNNKKESSNRDITVQREDHGGTSTSTNDPDNNNNDPVTPSPSSRNITTGEQTTTPAAAAGAAATTNNNNNDSNNNNDTTNKEDEIIPMWRIWFFSIILCFDIVNTCILMTEWIPYIRDHDGNPFSAPSGSSGSGNSSTLVPPHYTVYGSLSDLSIIAGIRIFFCFCGLYISYCILYDPSEFIALNDNIYHPNGDKKSREELEQELLEEPLYHWFVRYIQRPSFLGEFVAFITQPICIIKCLVRMNIEIGTLHDSEPYHPIYWFAIMFTTITVLLECLYLDHTCRLLGKYSKRNIDPENDDLLASSRASGSHHAGGLLSRVSSSLSIPLLSDFNNNNNDNNNDEEAQQQQEGEGGGGEGATITANGDTAATTTGTATTTPTDPSDVRGTSDITGDASYKATYTDLFTVIYPDLHLISIAFVFLILAALAQVYIPRFLGHILDSLADTFSNNNNNNNQNHDMSMFEVPGFIKYTKLLVIASILAGIFSGCRGSLFSVVGGRVNVRLRILLFDSLLAQDIGFFDITKTGDITSRLSSDTTLVGDQVTLNVNVFLRSLVQATGVLIFMFLVSWQLSIVAFISVPVITFISRWYGNYIRSLTKLMQKKLADGNSICDAALGSMSTVRSFDAAYAELHDFEDYMSKYLYFNNRSAVAYCGYAALTTSLPQLVFAVVMFYGGLLVRNGDMTSGQLVSFLLYLQSLSDAFAAIGYIFSSLTQAVGAADKVFELMHRKPKLKSPSGNNFSSSLCPSYLRDNGYTGIPSVKATKTRKQRLAGRKPSTSQGEITLENVELYYPARPQRRILHDFSLSVKPGSIVALVGQSGGGKSSVISLIQHLYEPSRGRVLIDGYPVYELCPAWLSRNVSIVSQEPTLFAKSIRKNIIYGLEGTDIEPTVDDVIQAAKLANADDFIQKMPQKYDTEVGERGVQLSGGQKQRIAIARALVRKPKVLLLDEATSALDAESEHLVQQSIDNMLSRGKQKSDEEAEEMDGDNNADDAEAATRAMTVIIVAHRLSTVRKADCIFVVKDGNVVESGTHNDLILDEDGAYASLIRRQMEAQSKLENGGA